MGARVQNPADRTIAAKVPGVIIERLRASAHQNDRTISGELRRILREWAQSAGGHDASS